MRTLDEWLTRGSIDVALLFYFFAIAHLAWFGRLHRWTRRRVLWSTSCGIYLAHVAIAFTVVHGWSHDHAVDVTARRVNETMGIPFGEGIFVSYLFTLVWLGDVIWWWGGPASYLRRPQWLEATWQFFVAFMVVNGAIVFETGVVRYLSLAGFAIVGLLAAFNDRRHSGPTFEREPHAPPES